MRVLNVRSTAIAAALLVASAAASALTIPTNALVADSVQKFSQEAMDGFELTGVTISPLGNAKAVANTTDSFAFPITSITVDSKLHIAGGEASGSALEIARIAPPRTPSAGQKVGIVLANFAIDYNAKKVFADFTPIGGVTAKKVGLFNFNVATPLGIKYKFPLTVTGREVLDQLTLTPESRQAQIDALQLRAFEIGALDAITTFGSLTQDIKVTFRKSVPTAPYQP
ncbi:hypothetical protein GTZ97_15255 [Aquabacterium fontiphilum]|jgi:hypothetical protein|uniref:hypothetical protein n=1 Tax=Aquabacterium fontiphilum TaxID=450365 RepID=UPI001377864B|nr:hypothetical protein [Aquabacterium fontiphilum]NBD22016.1 hypothetical protein [Aquabacterium fontiphilum]